MALRTRTQKFGSSRREGHDSTPFYRGRLYTGERPAPKATAAENPLPASLRNQVFAKDARHMEELPDRSVHLMVTSPPYNVGKEYDENLDLREYSGLLTEVFAETYRVLVDGGRACVNIANVGRKPYIPFHKHVIESMDSAGFRMRGEIIWDKGAGAGTSTAWGSWCSPSNPTLRDVHEYILVFSKGSYGRPGRGKKPTITKDQFLAWTKSIWSFYPESASRVGHPAPFPIELPYRCIQLLTYEGDVVLDPFCGAGTTCLAAAQLGRTYLGYDISPAYVELAKQRLAEASKPEKSRKRAKRTTGN